MNMKPQLSHNSTAQSGVLWVSRVSLIPEMSTYFARFPDFIPDPNAELLTEFARLATGRGWREGSKRYRRERRACLFSEYDQHVGGLDHPGKLQQLQALCSELRIQTRPNSIRQCKLVSLKTCKLDSGHGC